MPEILEIYDLKGKYLGDKTRVKYYKELNSEFKKTGKITTKVKTIRLILMTSQGRIYLQKRSKIKDQNAGLWDKTVGAHIMAGESDDIALIRECAEELGFPATVVHDKEFSKAVKTTNLQVIGIAKKVQKMEFFRSERILNNSKVLIQPTINTFYVGYYDGAIRFSDGETSGIEAFSPEDLKADLQKNPNVYTQDLKEMYGMYKKLLKPISR